MVAVFIKKGWGGSVNNIIYISNLYAVCLGRHKTAHCTFDEFCGVYLWIDVGSLQSLDSVRYGCIQRIYIVR